MPLVILDRDGVINADSDAYIKSLKEWKPLPGSIEAIAQLNRAGYTVAVATNQSGLGRGLFDLDDLEAMHEHLRELVEEAGGHIAGIFYCPHHPDEHCHCRKPKTGLFDAIEKELSIDPKGAIAIGDSLRDLEAALAKGCLPILVRTGKGASTEQQLTEHNHQSIRNTPVYDSLAEAVNHIIDGKHP